MLKVVGLQLLVALLVALVALLAAGVDAARSVLWAGGACVIPNFLFALRLTLASRGKASASAPTFFFGEFVKVLAIGVGMILAYRFDPNLVVLWFFIGLVLTLQANLLAFLVKL